MSEVCSRGRNGRLRYPGKFSAQRAGDSDRGDTYYLHWLKALEALVASKGVTSNVELARYERAWRNAAQRTVHGAAIVLSDVDLHQ